MVVDNQGLRAFADQSDAGRANPVRSAAVKRFLDHLPEGPFTATELQVELDQLDLSDLADSTAGAYRSAIRSFIRDALVRT